MNRSMFKVALLAAGVTVFSGSAFAQQEQAVAIAVKDGRVKADFRTGQISKAAVARNLASALGLSGRHSFVQVTEQQDKLGFTHTSYQQHYDGIPVDGMLVLVHSKGGNVQTVNGTIAPVGNLATKGSLSKERVVAIAAAELGIVRAQQAGAPQAVIAAVPGKAGDDYYHAYKIDIEGFQANKAYVKMKVYVDVLTGKVVRKLNLIHTADVPATATTYYSGVRNITTNSTPTGDYILRDDARNISTLDFSKATFGGQGIGNLLEYRNSSTVWGTVPTLDSVSLLVAGDTALFSTSSNRYPALVLLGSEDAFFPEQGPILDLAGPNAAPAYFPNVGYNLLNPPYLVGMTSLNVNNFDNFGEAFFQLNAADIVQGTYPWSDTTGSSGTYTINMQPNAALDVHWGIAETYDYFKNVFGRNSYDGNGSEITNLVNAASVMTGTQNQAGALGNGVMVYGLGDRMSAGPFTTLDVTGHEYSHMVTEANGHGGLIYAGESGALNESFSDIFGASIEFYAKGATEANWNIGEGIYLNGGIIRSMSNPKVEQNPDTYEGQYWIDPTNTSPGNDNGGVHYNSGVQNKWFYLLCEGGSGTNDKNDSYNVTAIGMDKAEQIAYRNLTTYLTPSSKYIDAYEGSLQATLDLFGNDTTSQEYRMVKHAWFAVGVGGEDNPTSVNEVVIGHDDLKLYPNPATQRVTIASSVAQPLEAQVLNVVGMPVMQLTISKGLNPVDISGLAKGIYMIRYNTGSKGYVQKLTVY